MDKKVVIIVTALTIAILGGGVLLTNKIANPPAIVIKNNQELIGDARHSKGDKNAKVTLIEIADFQCPACVTAQPFIKDILAAHKDEVYYVYRNFPLSSHKNSFNAAEAAEAAFEQGKYWEMFDLLYYKQNDWAETSSPVDEFTSLVKDLGLDENKFKKSLTEHKFKNIIEKDLQAATELDIRATPTFFINGEQFTGELKDLKSAVEQKM